MNLKRKHRRLDPGQTRLKTLTRDRAGNMVSCSACGERIPAASCSFHSLYDCRALGQSDSTGDLQKALKYDRTQNTSVFVTTPPVTQVPESCSAPTQRSERRIPTNSSERSLPPATATPTEGASSPSHTERSVFHRQSMPARDAFQLLMTPQRYVVCYWALRRITDADRASQPNCSRLQCNVCFAGEPDTERLLAEPHWRQLGQTRLPDALWRPTHARQQILNGSKIHTKVIWLAHETLYGAPLYEPLHQRLGKFETRLPRSLLLSALQKSIRRSYQCRVLHLSRSLVDHYGLGTLARRLLVITVEDCIAHPAMPILAWFIGAASKHYQPTVADVEDVLRYAAEISCVPVRDQALTRRHKNTEAFQQEWTLCEEAFKAVLPAAARSLVAAMLLRALFGGMHGDQLMLRDYALEWLRRLAQDPKHFLSGSGPVPLTTLQAPLLPSEWIAEAGARAWYTLGTTGASPPWLEFVERLYGTVRNRFSVEVRMEADQPLTLTDVPTAALGPFCGLPMPTPERARHSPCWRRIYRALREYDREQAPAQTWASLLWHLRAKLNVRPCWSDAFTSSLQSLEQIFRSIEDARAELEPSYTDERQRACWQQIAPRVEWLSEFILRRRYFRRSAEAGVETTEYDVNPPSLHRSVALENP
jgi:hypothetical protein